MSPQLKLPPKMMLGFVVRRCTVAVGHAPSAEEFAAWANTYREGERSMYLFGRAITVREAATILRHPARPVTARSAKPHERVPEEAPVPAGRVTSFAAAAARLRRKS